MVYIKQER